MYLGL